MNRRTFVPLCLAMLLGLLSPTVQGQDIAYHLSWDNPNSHYFDIRMEITNTDESHVDVRVPAWRPGRYILQNFAKNLNHFAAADESGNALPFQKIDKGTWRIVRGEAQTVVVTYKAYAYELDAGNSYLDETEAYFNPVNMMLYIPGKELLPVSFTLDKPADWEIATAMQYDETKKAFIADSYHDFADSPFIVSPTLRTVSFEHDGLTVDMVFQGEGEYDEEKLIADVRGIVNAQIDIMQTVPLDRYVILYHLLPRPMGHGVEHKNSTSIVMGPANFDFPGFYNGLMSVTSHEFFHVWNVERIRPEAIYHPDYSKEAYTTTMWIYEGITSYYTSLSRLRAGQITEDQYFRQIAGMLQGYDNTYGRKVSSVAMASWDSWTKAGAAPPNTFYSVYTAGNVLGLLLDLEVRGRTDNEKSLDDVFRYLYTAYAAQDRGVPEDGFEKALETVTGTSFMPFFEAYVYGTEDIDYNQFFQHAGLELQKIEDPNRNAVRLGVNIDRSNDQSRISGLTPESAAFKAGLDIDDVILAIDGEAVENNNISVLLKDNKAGDTVNVTIRRRGSERSVPVTLDGGANVRYEIHPMENASATQQAIKADWLRQL